MPAPSSHLAPSFADLIGPAAKCGRVLQKRIAALDPKRDTLKILLHGAPGVGKSELARLTAEALVGGRSHFKYAVEKLSGAALNAEIVRDWWDSRGLGSLFSSWTVKIIEEADRIPHVAQVLMLDYLDTCAPGTAILATSNADLSQLEARFQRRFQCFAIGTPGTEDIIAFLGQWPDLTPHERKMIAVGSAGCVGAALMDAQTALDMAA